MISIIIAVKNEEKYIERCLQSLIDQDFPKDQYEIIVVDGRSTDETKKIVKEISGRIRRPGISLYENPGIIPPAGWNVGLVKAEGDFILLFGGHATAPKDFLSRNWKTWEEFSKIYDNLSAVGGLYKIVSFENFTQKLNFVLLTSPFSGSNAYKRTNGTRVTTTTVYGMYKRQIVKEGGGFDESLKTGGDLEFNLRLGRKGYIMVTNSRINHFYNPRTNFMRMLKQIWNYGIAKGTLLRRGYPLPKAVLAPLFSAYFLSVILLFWLPFYWLPIIPYTFLNLAFSAHHSIKERDMRLLLALPLLYFYAHFSSGISIALGYLFRGWAHWR